MERFVIIDGNAILHRAFHAMPPLSTTSGEMVNAVYGFASMLFKVRDDLKPDYLAVTFDLPAPTFRKKMFKDYQVQRPEMDTGLVGQIEMVKEMVRVLGVPIYECSGFEADDVIGTLAFQSSKAKGTSDKLETVIVTGDRDILQLVDEATKVYMPVKGLSETVMYDREKVKEKLGIYPELVTDYKGLVGDASDNYPGVLGIGPKTAIDLLEKYGGFEEIYNNIEEVTGKTKEKLEKGRDGGAMSYKLATIVKDVPVELDLEKCRLKDFETEEAKGFFERMEFRSLVKRLDTSNKAQETSKKQKEEKNDENQMSLF